MKDLWLALQLRSSIFGMIVRGVSRGEVIVGWHLVLWVSF